MVRAKRKCVVQSVEEKRESTTQISIWSFLFRAHIGFQFGISGDKKMRDRAFQFHRNLALGPAYLHKVESFRKTHRVPDTVERFYNKEHFKIGIELFDFGRNSVISSSCS